MERAAISDPRFRKASIRACIPAQRSTRDRIEMQYAFRALAIWYEATRHSFASRQPGVFTERERALVDADLAPDHVLSLPGSRDA